MMKNNKNMLKKYIKALSNIFYERWRKYIGVTLSDEHTL